MRLPPTLMENPKAVAGGQDLVSFYTTPQYWLWDPSAIVFCSFAVFFAMIFADAGYSALLGLVVAGLWKKMGRSETGRRLRMLSLFMVGAGIVYGAMVGSYFGVSPEQDSVVARLNIIHMMDFDLMMQLSILLGVFHLVLANGVTAWNHRGSMKALKTDVVGLGFCRGGTLIWQGLAHAGAPASMKMTGMVVMGLGLIGVLLFTGVKGPLWKRLLKGLSGLTGISSAFSDALSYLRLFALGLASASLAGTFNAMAGHVKESLPGIGIFFALLIVLLGHTLNFVLAVASGFIHGLRLNFIEFFRWSITEEGHPFRAFTRKEKKVVENMILALGWLGVFSPLALGAVGSMIGCSRAGQAAIGAMLEIESGYGRFIGVSAMPSSQVIYGVVVTLTFGGAMSSATAAGIFRHRCSGWDRPDGKRRLPGGMPARRPSVLPRTNRRFSGFPWRRRRWWKGLPCSPSCLHWCCWER